MENNIIYAENIKEPQDHVVLKIVNMSIKLINN